MPEQLHVEIGTELFSYDGKTSTFAAEISGMGLPAVPKTLRVKSQWTGRVLVFRLARTVRDRDNDVTFWEYKSLTGGLSLVLFND